MRLAILVGAEGRSAFWFVRLVVAIAGLGQRVGAERGALAGFDDVVDHTSRGRRIVKVVDELGALVAEEAEVFEARRTA